MKKTIFLGALFFSLNAFSAIEVSPVTKIDRIMSFSEYGQGDVTVWLENNGAICTHGYWLRKADPGFDANLSLVLSAFHAQSAISIRGHTDDIWTGSSGTFCHVYLIDLTTP